MANSGTPWLLILAVGVLGYFVLSGTSPFKTGGGTTGGGTNIGDTNINVPPIGTVCESSTSPDVTFSAVDKENSGSSLTAHWEEEDNGAYKVDGGSWTNFRWGETVNNIGSPGDVVTFVGVTQNQSANSTYYAPFTELTLACKPTHIQASQLYVASNTTSSVTFFNSDHTASTAQAADSNDVKTVYVKFEAFADQYYGNPYIVDSGIAGAHSAKYPNTACVGVSPTIISKIEAQYGSDNLARVSTPIRHPIWTNESNITSVYCFEAPIITDAGQELKFYVTIEGTGGIGTATGEYNATLYASNFYIVDDGTISWGPEDDNGVPTTPAGATYVPSIRLSFS